MTNMIPKQTDEPSMTDISPIKLMDVVNIIRQRWRLGLGVALVAALLVAYMMLSKPQKYRSQATLIVEINPEKMIQLQDLSRRNENIGLYDTIMNSYLERLNSSSMASFVLENMTPKQLSIIKRAYPNAPSYVNEDGREFPNVADKLRNSMSSSWEWEVQIVTIEAIHTNPEAAQAIVQAYCNAFILLQSSRLKERTDQVLSFLQKQSEGLQVKLQEGETELQKYRSEKNLVSIEGSIDIVSQRLGQLNNALTQQKVELIAARNQMNQIEKAEDLKDLLRIPFILNNTRVDEIQSALIDAQSERKVLAETYGRRHPIMIENQTTINAQLQSLEFAVNSVVTATRKELEAIEAGYVELQNELQAAKTEALALDREAINYRVLQRKLDVQKQIFDTVSMQLTSTDVSSQFDMASIRILDGATLPTNPFAPSPKVAFLFASVIFLACFCGLPVALEMLDNRLKTFAQIENYIGKPVFGGIQMFKKSTNLTHAVAQNNEEVMECFRSIYGSFKLHTNRKPPYSLIVTSSFSDEGKTFVACNLAATFARQNLKVLLLDCDLRNPAIHRCFKLSNDFGLIEWINSDASPPTSSDISDDAQLGITCISDNLYVLPSGGSTKHTTEILDSKRFERLMSRLRDSFDILIIDTPPAGLFMDATLLTDFAENTLFVAKQNETTRQKARFTVNRFENTNAPVLGVVLNQIRDDFITDNGYSHKNYQRRYKNYYENDAS